MYIVTRRGVLIIILYIYMQLPVYGQCSVYSLQCAVCTTAQLEQEEEGGGTVPGILEHPDR